MIGDAVRIGDVVRYVKAPGVADLFEILEGLNLVVSDSYISPWDGKRYFKFKDQGDFGFAAQFFKIIKIDDFTLEEITA